MRCVLLRIVGKCPPPPDCLPFASRTKADKQNRAASDLLLTADRERIIVRRSKIE